MAVKDFRLNDHSARKKKNPKYKRGLYTSHIHCGQVKATNKCPHRYKQEKIILWEIGSAGPGNILSIEFTKNVRRMRDLAVKCNIRIFPIIRIKFCCSDFAFAQLIALKTKLGNPIPHPQVLTTPFAGSHQRGWNFSICIVQYISKDFFCHAQYINTQCGSNLTS